jgi:hypothetical protein
MAIRGTRQVVVVDSLSEVDEEDYALGQLVFDANTELLWVRTSTGFSLVGAQEITP